MVVWLVLGWELVQKGIYIVGLDITLLSNAIRFIRFLDFFTVDLTNWKKKLELKNVQSTQSLVSNKASAVVDQEEEVMEEEEEEVEEEEEEKKEGENDKKDLDRMCDKCGVE